MSQEVKEYTKEQIDFFRSLRGKGGRPITDGIEQSNLLRLVEPSNVGGTKLQTEYANRVISALDKIGVETHATHEANRTGFIFKKGTEILGSASRGIDATKGINLSSIGLEGRTGILDPLYKAESEFAREKILPVRVGLANDKTRQKFYKYYPEYETPKSGRYRWTPPARAEALNPSQAVFERPTVVPRSEMPSITRVARPSLSAGKDLLPAARLLGRALGTESASLGGLALKGLGRLAGPAGVALTAYDLSTMVPAALEEFANGPWQSDFSVDQMDAALSGYRTGPAPTATQLVGRNAYPSDIVSGSYNPTPQYTTYVPRFPSEAKR
jgi:hypothetical protein